MYIPMRRYRKIFHTVGFKIFQYALVRFFAPLVYRTRFPTVRLVSKPFVRSAMVLYEEKHCITSFFPYAARADKDFHWYSMYILPVSHPMKPYRTRDDKVFSMKKFENGADTNLGLCPPRIPQRLRHWWGFSHPCHPKRERERLPPPKNHIKKYLLTFSQGKTPSSHAPQGFTPSPKM